MSIDLDFELNADRLREECGVFGIYGHPDAAALTALGLHALQHRGQEAAGIVSFDGERFQTERRLGLVGDHFSSAKVIDRLKGRTKPRRRYYKAQDAAVVPLITALVSARLRARARLSCPAAAQAQNGSFAKH